MYIHSFPRLQVMVGKREECKRQTGHKEQNVVIIKANANILTLTLAWGSTLYIDVISCISVCTCGGFYDSSYGDRCFKFILST